MENVKLTEVETDLSDGIAILFGYMDEGSNELVLSTMASMETDRYEFFMSFDDGVDTYYTVLTLIVHQV